MRVAYAALLACGCRQILGFEDLNDVRDSSVDSSPASLTLERVAPLELLEGTGTGGGRSTVVVVHGTNFVAGAEVTFAPHVPGRTLSITTGASQVSGDGRILAVPIVVEVDTSLNRDELVQLDVTVSQPDPISGTITQTISELPGGAPVMNLRGFDELTGGTVSLATGIHDFSRVQVSSILAANNTFPLIIRSTGSINIFSVDVSASSQSPGPGGGSGGTGGPLNTNGSLGVGDGKGFPNGGGGGYLTNGQAGSTGAGGNIVGFDSMPVLVSPHRGSGGGGGRGGTTTVGGNGGGGGGSLELTAGGTLDVFGTISARGGASQDVGGIGATDGGGGSGGAVILRSGVGVTAPDIDRSGGLGSGDGGDGSVGRLRVDVPRAFSGAGYQGPMLDPATDLVTAVAQPQIQLRGQPGGTVEWVVLDDMKISSDLFSNTINILGTATITMPLSRGFNTLCFMVAGGTLTNATSFNCFPIASVAD